MTWQFFLPALLVAVALDIILIRAWRKYNRTRLDRNLMPIEFASLVTMLSRLLPTGQAGSTARPSWGERAQSWLGQITLLDLLKRGRWRLWVLLGAILAAYAAQNSFPEPQFINDTQPISDSVWRTLFLLEGPFQPFRPAIGLYLLAVCLVIIAFIGDATPALPWQRLEFLPDSAEANQPAVQSSYQFRLAQWRFALNIEGPPQPWIAIGISTLAFLIAIGLSTYVYTAFSQIEPHEGSNSGLALWLLAVNIVLTAAVAYDTFRHPTLPPRSFSIALGLALALALVASSLLWPGYGNMGMVFWLGSLGALALAWWLGNRTASTSASLFSIKLTRQTWIEIGLFTLIFAVACYFRLANITDLAPGVNNDAAEAGRLAIKYAQGGAPFTPYTNVGWAFETLFIYIIALWVQWVQPAYLALRLATASVAIATLPAVYVMARRVGGPSLALLSTALLAVSGIHIVFSTVGLRLIIQPLFESITLFFFWRALDRYQLRDFIFGGLFLGLAIHAHNSSRPNPVLYFVFFLFLFVSAIRRWQGFLVRYALPVTVAALAALIAIAPMAGYAATKWGIYNGRANFVFVGHRMTDMEAAYPGAYWSPLVRNIFIGSLVFNYRGNGNDFFIDEPAFDFPVTLLLALGLAYTLRHWRKPLPFFLLCWFGMGVATGYLSEPNANRTVGAVLPAYVMIALFLLNTASLIAHAFGERAKYVASAAIALLVIYIGANTYRDYVGPDYRYRWGFAEDATAFGAYAGAIHDRNDSNLFVTTEYWVTDVLRLMTYQPGEDPYSLPYYRLDLAQAMAGDLPQDKPAVFLLGNWTDELLARQALLDRYPGSAMEEIPRLKTHWPRDGVTGYAVTIPISALQNSPHLANGLRANFYRGLNWQGQPYASYVDRFISFWVQPPYVPYSASWEGTVQIDQPGEYIFYLLATNRAQLFVDHTPLITLDAFDIQQANLRHDGAQVVTLDPGPHTLRILYNYEGGDQDIKLRWQPPDTDGLNNITFENFIPAPLPR